MCRRAGIDQGEQGKAIALENSPHQWRERFERALTYLACLEDTFTVDDVIHRAGLPRSSTPNANNAVGALMSAAAKRGQIIRIGYEAAARTSSHGRAIAKWQGVKTWSATNY
jgi:hypothetical protein